jgi:hypothetical protein
MFKQLEARLARSPGSPRAAHSAASAQSRAQSKVRAVSRRGSRRSRSPARISMTRSNKRGSAFDAKLHKLVDAIIQYHVKILNFPYDNNVNIAFTKRVVYYQISRFLEGEKEEIVPKLRNLLLKLREAYQKARYAGFDVDWVNTFPGTAY